MKKRFLALVACGSVLVQMAAAQTVFIHEPTIPVVVGRANNIIFDLRVSPTMSGERMTGVTVDFPQEDLPYIQAVRVFYTGTTSMLGSRTASSGLTHAMAEYGGGQTIFDHPAYAIRLAEDSVAARSMTLEFDQELFPWTNYFYVSLSVADSTPLTHVFRPTLARVELDGERTARLNCNHSADGHRPAVTVRTTGDDGVNSYRIPGLATTPQGTLLGVYDVRNHNSIDLQEDIQVGLSRSTDGGQTWKPMQRIMDMTGYGSLPRSHNGVGDPAIVVDPYRGRVWVMALWTHGMGGGRGWWASRNHAMTPEEQTGQVLLVYSDDDGMSWSEPQNITEQIKNPTWHLILQGPGRGIVMADSTLVFPIQWTDSTHMPYASIVWSRDNGQTWTIGAPAFENTTEAQVVELEPGVLMLNMRRNGGDSRAICVTRDMGRTWEEHPTSRSALREPVCMASLIKVPAAENALGRDILLFANPDTTTTRSKITIKASLDHGRTWLPENQLLLDEEPGWGYSCLTMIDPETVGILYESSVAQMTFQAIPLRDIVKREE